jgi:hypothetical protein
MNRSPSSNWELGVLYTQLLHLAKFYTWIQHAHISNGDKFLAMVTGVVFGTPILATMRNFVPRCEGI